MSFLAWAKFKASLQSTRFCFGSAKIAPEVSKWVRVWFPVVRLHWRSSVSCALGSTFERSHSSREVRLWGSVRVSEGVRNEGLSTWPTWQHQVGMTSFDSNPRLKMRIPRLWLVVTFSFQVELLDSKPRLQCLGTSLYSQATLTLLDSPRELAPSFEGTN